MIIYYIFKCVFLNKKNEESCLLSCYSSDYIAYRRVGHNLYVKKQSLLSWGITCRIDDASLQ